MALKPAQRARYFRLRAEGMTIAQACKSANFSEATAYRVEKQWRETRDANKALGRVEASDPVVEDAERIKSRFPAGAKQAKREANLPGPIPLESLNKDAKACLEDFGAFRLRYFGRSATPWQIDAALKIRALLDSEDREYVVMNVPPGSGKTTLLHDIICWLIVRNRGIRIIMGSATGSLAARGMMRVRRSLERTVPVQGDPYLIGEGVEFDAVATLAGDYGRFRPLDRELWTRDAFIVMQHNNISIEDKEPTISAYGVDSGFIGGRFDFSVWDDLVDKRHLRSAEQREALEEWYVDTCETRLEPGGLHLLVGQRLASDDLYRFALDLSQPQFGEDGELLEEESMDEDHSLVADTERAAKKYKHIIYKAHYEDRCEPGSHKRKSPSYPEGCLLDPHRIPYREISAMMTNRNKNFRVVYQQEDVDRDEVLVPRDWITGGGNFIGCIDYDRDAWQIPPGLRYGDCVVLASADPSPTMFWSIQLWIYHEESQQRFLIAHVRAKLEAPQFLDYNPTSREYSGVMHEWQMLSLALGWPIHAWVVEQNAAQRFLLQYSHVKDWRRLYGVDIVPHTTAANKADPNYGVTTIAPHYRHGRVRLPGKGEGKIAALKLVDEVTRYPHGRTDDCVMAQWIFEWTLPRFTAYRTPVEAAERPSWLDRVNF